MKTMSLDTDTEKLRVLQEQDVWRPWQSLDEHRHCIICERTFSGHDIRVTLDRRGFQRAQCPTAGCVATPREWLFPGNPLTDENAWQDWLRILDELGCEETSDPQNHAQHPALFAD